MEAMTREAVGLFALFVFPGLVSMHVYQFLMPSRRTEWGVALVQGLFYSWINLILLLPFFLQLFEMATIKDYSVPFWLRVVTVMLLGPTLWPIGLCWLFRRPWIARRFHVPYPSAWDFYFDLRRPAFVLVHLTNSALIGAYWGPKSYAASFPNDGDIYFQAVYSVDEHGQFMGPTADTQGMLIRRDQYRYLELYSVPEEE